VILPKIFSAPAFGDDVVVAVDHVSKTFRLRRTQTLRETLVAIARKKKLTDQFEALHDVHFTVQRGESIALIGLNGSGKSTTLKMISGVLNPTCGKVWTRGRVAGLIEVGAGFHPDLSGRENVYLNAAILGMSKAETDEKFDEIVEFSGIERFIDTEVKHYSSGMFIRLAFSVAIHTHADVLLVDEVLSVGDAPFQEKCLAKIAEVQASGATLVIVSHDLATVKKVCTRGLLMRDGRVAFDGPAEEAAARMASGA
jgi:ABC-2 type transport system ATP-binding protein